MNNDRHIWRVWARLLQQWGVTNGLAGILEACGPLSLFGAQMLYLGQPFLKQAFPEDHLNALVQLLEDPIQTRAFVSYLREVGEP